MYICRIIFIMDSDIIKQKKRVVDDEDFISFQNMSKIKNLSVFAYLNDIYYKKQNFYGVSEFCFYGLSEFRF